MEKELLFERIKGMILSSSKKPKYMSISTVKVADILGVRPKDVEEELQRLVHEGKLIKSKLEEAPHSEVYSLP
ncbi:hypothetical protein [Bacillus badius]|uniref:Phage protein n=1 Tax=Bacillus badius TaxID=1455 RepID=A0ABR5AXB6_BACBA|nr:hypothetical protein [Bacillus badius]KIL76073.1 hypothetical protein SD78_0175 [Bacillus badius]KIL79363.1 hypothetical protein SD77_3229 [Bacillus badius]MED4716546.1 hypothetical protein [Bacillus badius]